MRNRDWIKYKNGNYAVYINKNNGTKIRKCHDDEYKPMFPENCDVLISTKCDHGCPWCYAGCSNNGSFGDILSWNFIHTLHPYTELAINLNFPMHPDLYKFLEVLKKLKVFANITINQDHFMVHEDVIKDLYDKKLIFGLGVSLTDPTPEFIERVSAYPNAVIHVINGILTQSQVEALEDKGLKMLILGYKDFGFGGKWHKKDEESIRKNSQYLYDNLEEIADHFNVVSFDNLALEQLQVRRLLTDEEWDFFYMGDDGTMTFAINLVDGTFSPNSISTEKYEIGDKTIDEMFKQILK